MIFDPDGGDLGRANKQVTGLELQLLVPHIANVLEELSQAKLLTPNRYFNYAFEIPSYERDAAMFVIYASITHLPPHVSWYESNGDKLFEMRGPSGGIVTSYICYLIARP